MPRNPFEHGKADAEPDTGIMEITETRLAIGNNKDGEGDKEPAHGLDNRTTNRQQAARFLIRVRVR